MSQSATRRAPKRAGTARISNSEAQARIEALEVELREAHHKETTAARLLQESLAYQTATSDVMKVISASTGDLQPVLDTLVETAARLCEAEMGFMYRRDHEVYSLAANIGFPRDYEAFIRTLSIAPGRNSVTARAALERAVVHVHDIAADPEYAVPQTVQLGKARTVLGVPLLREGEPIGVLALARQRVEPFTERQIDLVRTFADQAVIAIENARLITETREALEQQTGTAEVLGVINSSQGDLSPVFDAMLENAMRLCGAAFGELHTYDARGFRTAATRGLPERYAAWRARDTVPYGPGTAPAQLLAGAPLVHINDLTATELYQSGDPNRRALVDLGGARSCVTVPLRKQEDLLGAIMIYRQEAGPFTEKQIALLQSFAAQAVIAMENARLINETREALEQQTATSEVLGVINSSPGDLTPVFDAMLERAIQLCEASCGHFRTFDGELLHLVAARGVPQAYAEFLRTPVRPHPDNPLGRILLGERLVVVSDAADDESYRAGDPLRRAYVELGGARSAVNVALVKEDKLLGTLTVYRQEVRPFTDKHIALLQSFSAQAVIAMENARLITETREALDQQTATADVLQVINSSPGDLTPVFDAILKKAMSLCGIAFGALQLYEEDKFQAVAVCGVAHTLAELLREPIGPIPGAPPARLLSGEPFVHVPDMAEVARQLPDDPRARANVADGLRTVLFVPLRRDAELLGYIAGYRKEVRPFTDKQIALLQNFAAQAVIAMENARLITETREALQKQTATAEILRVISASPTDLQPTFDAIAEKATTVCGAECGSVFRFDGSLIHFAAHYGWDQQELQAARSSFPMAPGDGSMSARAILVRQVAHSADVSRDDAVQPALAHAFRTVLSVPILRDGNALGAITLTRREVQPFTEAQIELLKTFADQAVIAIENTRLFNELQERTHDLQESLEYQTATSDVLKVISESTSDAQPAFEMIVETAAKLCDADHALIMNREDDGYRCVATFSVSPEYDALARGLFLPTTRGSVTGRTALEGRTIHITDIASDPEYRLTEVVKLGASRTALGVPLLREGTVVGTINLARNRVQSFTDRQIELVSTFADQAVIALENARLITETREALEQQTATAEVLGVINSSPGNLTPVFDAMLDKALSICQAALGGMFVYEAGQFRTVSLRGAPLVFAEFLREPLPPQGALAQIVDGEALVQIPDVRADPSYAAGTPGRRALADLGGARTAVWLSLRKDDVLLGVIWFYRTEVRLFSDKQIALLKSFAVQAVIAMENARLLDEIRQRQAELRVTFDNMVDGVAMFDQTLHLGAWNRNFQNLLQLPDELLAARPGFDEYIRYLTKRGEFGESDPEREITRLRSRLTDHYSFERTRPDGTVIEVRNNPMPDGGTVVIYSDITERKRSEAEIRAARDAAEAAYRDLKAAQANLVQAQKMAALGQLTAGIAHEIKNPLNFVNNFAGLSIELLDELKESATPAIEALEDYKRAEIDEAMVMLTGNLEKIAEHGRRADNIVRSMLEHSRGVSGERREVDLNALIDEALNLAYHGARAQDQSFNITLERDYASTLKPVELSPQEITRVFLNLFGNGFYATTNRAREDNEWYRPVLSVVTREGNNAVEVRVRDNGIGIPPEVRDKLFQPFFTTKPTGEGTGLGLSISYDIVTQQHGGTITVESEPGAFTEFTIRLPR